MAGFDASFTVDLEPDCPPFLHGFRGVEQGLPRLLDVLTERGVRATFFTTGDVARRFPEAVRSVVDAGHELACHGMTHTPFTSMSREAARREIVDSATILREFATVSSFRAPYLKFPDTFLDIVSEAGFSLDSSQAKYKWGYRRSIRSRAAWPVSRIPASLTSSALRIPKVLRDAYLRALEAPVVLFVHPWEFVDLRAEKIRYDCRFRTGEIAVRCISDVLLTLSTHGARFRTMRELQSAMSSGGMTASTRRVDGGHGVRG